MPQADYLRAALFVDFDNVYSGLRERDPQAAEGFAQDPLSWLAWLEAGRHALAGGPDEAAAPAPRRVLLRRCYLNPAAFWRQRAGFVQAGFQVVDCPALTWGGKNSADIQMALDVVEALGHETRFDEFLLLSGDADFAPVLLRLRLHDRRTTILASERVAPALRASADVVVPLDRFLREALGATGEAQATAGEPALRFDGGGQAPAEPGRPESASLIERVCAATGVPPLPGETYDALFEALAASLQEGARAQADVVHGTRRRLAEAGVAVAERDIGFLFYGFRLARLDLDQLAGDVDALAEAFRENVRHRCRERGLQLGAADEAALDDWLLGAVEQEEGAPAPGGAAARGGAGAAAGLAPDAAAGEKESE